MRFTVKTNICLLREALVSSCFMVASIVSCVTMTYAANATDFGPAHVGETSVTLYPNSALVTTQIVLDRNHPELHIMLPANADTSTFTLNTSGRRIMSMEERRQKALPSAEVAELLATRKDLAHELALLDAEDKVLDSQAAFWAKSDPNTMMGNAQDSLHMLDAMAENLQKRTENLVVARHKVALEREAIQENMRDVENAMKAMGGTAFLNGTPLVPVMVVYFDAKSIPDTEAARAHMYPNADTNTAQPVMNMVNLVATYSYVMRGCGWTPTYRFEAFVDATQNITADQKANGTILYDAMAAIHQNSGAPWHNVNLSLASTMPSRRMSPYSLRQWHVNEQRPTPQPRPMNMAEKRMAPAMASNAMMSESADFAAADSMPVQQDEATFSTWDLGTQSIPSGETRTMTLSTDRVPATFYRLIRPSIEKTSYLAADMTLPEKVTMPAGKALHILHGAVLGEQYFTSQGRDITLYFGQDPKVYASMTPRTISSGNDGVFDRKQTHTWSWDIAVHNDHAATSGSNALPIKIEEAAPQLHHEDFTVTLNSKPAPRTKVTAKGKTYTWSLELAPQSKTVIKHELVLHAPEDMVVEKGRGLE